MFHSFKSFETVIKPMVLYVCEIWGQNYKKDSIMMQMPKFDVSLPCERLYILFFYYFINVPHHFPIKNILKNIHMAMVHSKKNYVRLGSLKDKHTKFRYISIF